MAKSKQYRIKALRVAMKMTQKELANRANISSAYLHDLENNNRGAKPETVERIANALGVSASMLVEQEAG